MVQQVSLLPKIGQTSVFCKLGTTMQVDVKQHLGLGVSSCSPCQPGAMMHVNVKQHLGLGSSACGLLRCAKVGQHCETGRRGERKDIER